MGNGGLAVGPPDFVGVGAQRSGTTWWYRMLREHPEIRGPVGRQKEVHFFAGFGAREMCDTDIDAYHRRFPRRPGEIAGEWTPRYMAEMWTPRLLRRAAPDAKLLVMLRDPVERYRSGVPWAIGRAPERDVEVVAAEAIERGRYASQLRRLRSFFDPERILVQQYERCRENPVGEYRRTLRFLGVSDDHRPDLERPRGATMAAHKEPVAESVREALVVVLEPEVRALAELVPDLELERWPNFAHLAADEPAGLSADTGAADARP